MAATRRREAVALWQGFAWQPRVGPELWAEISKAFLASFTEDRIAKLGDVRRTMAQLLTLAGVEFRSDDLSAERAQAAIKTMSSAMRDAAIWWLWGYPTEERRRN